MRDPYLSKRYFRLLALPETGPSDAHKAALARAHELRKFEIENYWKRSTYFWGFQLVAFTALALAFKDGKFQLPLVIIIAVLGTLTALAGALTAGGSKFWQANWEAHVDYLEDAVEGHLHKIALVEGRLSFSVSRVNRALLQVLCAGWFCAFLAASAALWWPCLIELPARTARIIQIGMPALALLIGAAWITIGNRSDLRGRAYNRKTLTELARR